MSAPMFFVLKDSPETIIESNIIEQIANSSVMDGSCEDKMLVILKPRLLGEAKYKYN